MAMASETGQKIPLGVGRILSDSFSILFDDFFKVLVIGLIPIFSIGVLAWLAYYSPAYYILLYSAHGYLVFILLVPTIIMVVYGLITALVVQLAYDAQLGRSHSLGTYLRSAVPALLPIIILTIVTTVLAYIGAFALLIGMVWVYAVFFVMAPAAVIERAGFGAMRRSAALTKEYRWPIVGAFLVVAVINTIFSRVAEFLAEFASFALPPSIGSLIVYGVAMSSIVGLGFSYGGIVSALVYARLREIKEGVDIDQLAAVFD